MGIEGLQITPEELRNSAKEMEARIKEMREVLEGANRVMTGTEGSFQSTGGEEIRARYNILKNKFNDFYMRMEEYAEFLKSTAGKYEQADVEIAKKADEILKS